MFDWLFAPRYPERRKVVVNTKGEEPDFRGLLWEKNREYLVLKGAELVHGRETPIPMDGDVIVYRADVSCIQVLF